MRIGISYDIITPVFVVTHSPACSICCHYVCQFIIFYFSILIYGL
jgi:hypothetical protein